MDDDEKKGKGVAMPKKKAVLGSTWQSKLLDATNTCKVCKRIRLATECKKRTSRACVCCN